MKSLLEKRKSFWKRDEKARPQCRVRQGFSPESTAKEPGPARPRHRVWMRLEREGIREDVYGRAPFISLVCGNKSWIKQPQPAWRGSTCDVDYPKREPGKKTPIAFNRRQGKRAGIRRENAGEAPWSCRRSRWNGSGNRWPLPTRLGKVTAGAGAWEGFAAYEQC